MFSVRVATGHDIAAVDALLARAYPRLLKADYLPSVLVTVLPMMSRAQPALVTCGTYYVVEDAGAIIGAGGWTTAIPGGNPGGAAPEPGRGNVRHVVTDDRQVRRGVGRALIGHICDTARASGMTWLHCVATLTAVPFYRAVGFTDIGPLTLRFGAGIAFPAMEMRRAL